MMRPTTAKPKSFKKDLPSDDPFVVSGREVPHNSSAASLPRYKGMKMTIGEEAKEPIESARTKSKSRLYDGTATRPGHTSETPKRKHASQTQPTFGVKGTG